MPPRLTLILALLAAPAQAELVLTSPDFVEGATLPEAQVLNGFGCSGANLSPALSWSGAPEGTKSYVLTLFDPDAPTGSGWWHWTVANIPADSTALAAGASSGGLPAGAVEGRTDFGAPGYGGACPPEGAGVHHYVFTLYAMPEAALPVDAGTSGAMVGYLANAMALEQARLTVTYGR
ncbi:MAG: YbhB/YbcL family Raf kinase inhibitor-like protein [Tabrizicola sp.]